MSDLLGSPGRTSPEGMAVLFGLRHRGRPGAAPGTVQSDPEALPPQLHVFLYDEHGVESFGPFDDLAAVETLDRKGRRMWLDIAGLRNVRLIETVGRQFNLHPLALEDAVNVHQRPKCEVYPDHTYIVLRMLKPEQPSRTEQVSVFLNEDTVITMQEEPGDCFGPVRKRLLDVRARMRRKGSDYLAYALVDAVVDAAFPVLEALGDRLETLEEQLLEAPPATAMQEIHLNRRELLVMRRMIWPLREALAKMSRESQDFIGEDTRMYLRDTYDHAIQLIDLIETYRDLSASLLDLYLSSIGQRTNEVMKTLTLVATIFIPLSFIAGLYGMNFDTTQPANMPELRSAYGYPAVLTGMATLAIVLLAWFYRRGWLARG